jgi:threonine-phosphate decarboxylase
LKKKELYLDSGFPKRVIHGGFGKRQLEKTRKDVLDFSASVNPFPPKFSWNCNPLFLSHYPDDQYLELKERIAQVYRRTPEEICVGNGSIEIIRTFCWTTLQYHKKFFTESPTFGEYELSAQLIGCLRTQHLLDADIVFICNPNNPTGILRSKNDMKNLLGAVASENHMLFCDEAFIDLADPAQSLSDITDSHLFVLHSLTKSFSIPGIRFGFGFGDPDLIEKIETVRPPWSVNAFAEAFAMEALNHRNDLAISRAAIERERAWLETEISALGLQCCPSSANFIMIELKRDVAPVCKALERYNILVRDCTSFGLPTTIRIAVMKREDNRALVEALTKCVL